ncbi:hypothetical protein ASD38_16500 [Caulobacter sp. Root487D2Y]|uniref:DUF736 domain-containing protein n=1 Tax=Caulobacter sp. Root487D2Y TaxID=1736547 RepID=UPI0006F4CAFA|nr:DUF736 family protein [Caulobacter sp. Root487D2Y]KQY28284.1 hypothetical protein ASD38_16500 [Caulobacter sp. Root487D2Y]
MTATLGFVTRLETGAFKGHLRTLNISADIDVVPVRDKTSSSYPDYRVVSSGVEIGAGWTNVNQTSQQPYVGLTLAHPDIGPRTYKVKLGRAAGQDDDDVFALIWNPED